MVMAPSSRDLSMTDLVRLLPEDRVGVVERVAPITMGLSGAAVYAVTTSRGACVLRVQRRDLDEESFAQQLRILRRAADAGIAPPLLHVDEAARAVVSRRAAGVPMAAVLADPAQRGPLLASIVDRLRTLHALDASGVAERDPVGYARAAAQAGRARPGFPPWAASLAPALDEIAAALAGDPRRGPSHNDVNPNNVLWDGARAWLVDWEVAALGHPHYDLAALALVLRLEDDVALALRRLAGLLNGLMFLSLVDDLSVLPAPTREVAPSLATCYAAIRAGKLDVQSPHGRAAMGLALLAEGVAG
jgi:thiamine kinase-like enzyme